MLYPFQLIEKSLPLCVSRLDNNRLFRFEIKEVLHGVVAKFPPVVGDLVAPAKRAADHNGHNRRFVGQRRLRVRGVKRLKEQPNN